MAIRTLLKFRNLDLTKDINERFKSLIIPGIFEGGEVTPVIGLLKIELSPWKAISKDGMVAIETSEATQLDTPPGQSTVICARLLYRQNNDPIVTVEAIEATAFSALTNRDEYVVFAYVNVPSSATQTLAAYVDYANRDIIDKVGRGFIRGIVNSVGSLPPVGNKLGDLWIVVILGSAPNIFGWDGSNWRNMTDVVQTAADLANHRANLFVNEKHLTDDEKDAVANASHPLSASNPVVDSLDERLPTQSENDALAGSDGTPSNTNRYITQAYPLAVPTEFAYTTRSRLTVSGLFISGNTINLKVDGSPISPVTYSTSHVNTINALASAIQSMPTVVSAIVESGNTSILITNLNPVGAQITDLVVTGGISQAPIAWAHLSVIELTSVQGPIYVGTSGSGTAQAYVRIWDRVEDREYINSSGFYPNVVGVYTDSLCTTELDPMSEIPSRVDEDGFWIDLASLYIKTDLPIDSNARVVYGRRETLKSYPIDGLLRRTPLDGQTSSETIRVIETIKGRKFDDIPPVEEQNIELRKDIVSLKEYLSTIYIGDHVVGDFSRADGVPEFNENFVENIGVNFNYSYLNTGLVGVAYANSTGTITYASGILTASVLSNQVFIDGSGKEYKIQSVTLPNVIVIRDRKGNIPFLVNTTFTKTEHGSCKPDNNPRRINLADFRYIIGRQKIGIRTITPVLNEFHPDTGEIAFEINSPINSLLVKEPRVRLYGTWVNDVQASDNYPSTRGDAKILVTGIFTDLYLLAAINDSDPFSVNIKIDGVAQPAINLSTTTNPIADWRTQTPFQVATNLSDGHVHTVEISTSSINLRLFGLELVRRNTLSALTMPGRAFVQTDIVKNDTTISESVAVLPPNQRGLVMDRYINRSGVLLSQNTYLTEFDGLATPPAGTAVAGLPNITFISGISKLAQYFRVGDVVKLVTTTSDQVLVISSISSGLVGFTSNVQLNGPTVMYHLASTQGEELDAHKEYARHDVLKFGPGIPNDFSGLNVSAQARSYTLEDGVTMLATPSCTMAGTGVPGATLAARLIGTNPLNVRAVATRIDLLLTGTAVVNYSVSVDGSPAINKVFNPTKLARETIFLNGRYQSHEVSVVGDGLQVAGIILFEPTSPTEINGTRLATRNVLSYYVTTNALNGAVAPIGSAAFDASVAGARLVKGTGVGTGWTSSLDFSQALFNGRLLKTEQAGSSFEFDFEGEGFEVEYSAGPDRGIVLVQLNGIVANSSNYSATFRGVTPATGRVDMYETVVTRKRFGIVTLPFARYTVRVSILDPRVKNLSSTGFGMTLSTIYLLNTNGTISYTPSQSLNLDVNYMESTRDNRNFDPGTIRYVTEVKALAIGNRDYYSVGNDPSDDFVGYDGIALQAALVAAAADPTKRKVVIRSTGSPLNLGSPINVSSGVEITSFGSLTISGSGGTCFNVVGSNVVVSNIRLLNFSLGMAVNGNTNVRVTNCAGMSMSGTNNTTVFNDRDTNFVVGTTDQIAAGFANYTFDRMCTDIYADAYVKILPGNYTSTKTNVTLNRVVIDGQDANITGPGSGILFIASGSVTIRGVNFNSSWTTTLDCNDKADQEITDCKGFTLINPGANSRFNGFGTPLVFGSAAAVSAGLACYTNTTTLFADLNTLGSDQTVYLRGSFTASVASVIDLPSGTRIEGDTGNSTGQRFGTVSSAVFRAMGNNIRLRFFSGGATHDIINFNGYTGHILEGILYPGFSNAPSTGVRINELDTMYTVGSSSEYARGEATYTDMTLAVNAAPAGSKIEVKTLSSSGSLTISKQLTIVGQERNSLITSALTFSSTATAASVKSVAVSGNIVFQAGSRANQYHGYQATGAVVSDSGTDNLYVAIDY